MPQLLRHTFFNPQVSAMPKVNGILESSLYVNDLERSLKFYCDLFRFQIIATGDRLVALAAAKNQILLLFKKGASAQLPKGATDGDGELHLAFSISTEEFFDWKEKLIQNNIMIEEEKVWDYGGKSIYFRDPDRHLIELATPGVWRDAY